MDNLHNKNGSQQLLHSIEEFLDDASLSAVQEQCPRCGSLMQAVPATFSLWGTDKKWKISLNLCPVCESEAKSKSGQASQNGQVAS